MIEACFLDSFRAVDVVNFIAIIAGPILAVAVAEFIRTRAEKRARRLQTFKTLMATRSLPFSLSHVEAINFIELEFRGEKEVMGAWTQYRNHLDDGELLKANAALWGDKRKERLNDLLSKISIALRLTHEAAEIEKGVYYPARFSEIDSENDQTRKLWLEILKGERQLPMKAEIYQAAPPSAPAQPSASPPAPPSPGQAQSKDQ